MYLKLQRLRMYYLFFIGAVASMGKEQFLGVYITAGVLSSMSSYFHKAVLKQSALSLGAVSFTHAGLTAIVLCFVWSAGLLQGWHQNGDAHYTIKWLWCKCQPVPTPSVSLFALSSHTCLCQDIKLFWCAQCVHRHRTYHIMAYLCFSRVP